MTWDRETLMTRIDGVVERLGDNKTGLRGRMVGGLDPGRVEWPGRGDWG